jgi:hypothetical protein
MTFRRLQSVSVTPQKRTLLGPIGRASPCLRSEAKMGTTSINSAQQSTFLLMTETDCGLRKVVC